VRIAYFDEAGLAAEEQEPIVIVAAVLIDGDREWRDIEGAIDMLRDLVVPAGKSLLPEFKAKMLFSGDKKIRDWTKTERWSALEAFLKVLSTYSLPILWGGIDKESMRKAIGSQTYTIDTFNIVAHNLAFLLCLAAIEGWLTRKHPDEVAICIADEARAGTTLKALQNQFRKEFPLLDVPKMLDHLVDTVYFGSSHDSIGLQLADHCNFLIKRHEMQKPDSEPFYRLIEKCVAQNEVVKLSGKVVLQP
jgi:hypothetical protein